MIGKIAIGKSFKGCLLYCLNDKLQDPKKEQVMKDRAEILLFNQCYGNQKELIQQFNEVRQLNPKLSKPVLHITLSFVPGEELPKDKLIEMCQDFAIDMGFENNQYVAIHHKDTSHQHLHIVANRIGFDKRTVSDSNNFQKIAAYCRKMELKFNLTQVLSPRRFLPKDQHQIPRQDERKEKLKNSIQKTLQQVSNYQQFEQVMKALGYQVLKARGISFIDDKKVKIKGSEVGFSLMKIEKILAVKQNHSNINKHENLQQTKSQNLESNVGKVSPLLPQKIVLKKQSRSPVIDLQKKVTDLIFPLIEPEKIADHLSPELLKKRRKKKRQRPHH
ncbi:MAG: relaxase/mobilization nuclease domain-containing protein [Ferruginibacter sp.]|nr:relaxase/mobilization nuclease domain-containing protein [Ferruginibacter sp.]